MHASKWIGCGDEDVAMLCGCGVSDTGSNYGCGAVVTTTQINAPKPPMDVDNVSINESCPPNGLPFPPQQLHAVRPSPWDTHTSRCLTSIKNTVKFPITIGSCTSSTHGQDIALIDFNSEQSDAQAFQ